MAPPSIVIGDCSEPDSLLTPLNLGIPNAPVKEPIKNSSHAEPSFTVSLIPSANDLVQLRVSCAASGSVFDL